MQRLEVGQLLVAAEAAAGEADQHRTLGAEFGQADFLARPVLDAEVRRGLADLERLDGAGLGIRFLYGPIGAERGGREDEVTGRQRRRKSFS